ncbi:hypothetical protein JOQ06_010735 [Pogonophryne albipinna]|uniref:Uncharacterized protein n=1 Tax=Pogonophryne albipinna TaxID=1090488 RepID=A0AAD6AUJ5_9TELE|nr:hypothetical protein JOQ06_010735 [Pogonophryne albipinna]
MWFLYVICPVNNISCPCMFHSLPPTGFGPRLVVNPDDLDLLPETVARGQERPLKVTLLSGHRGLDADMGSLAPPAVHQNQETQTKTDITSAETSPVMSACSQTTEKFKAASAKTQLWPASSSRHSGFRATPDDTHSSDLPPTQPQILKALIRPSKESLVTRGDSTSPQNYHRTILAIHEAIKWDALPLDLKAAKDGVPVEALYLATSASLLVPQPSVAVLRQPKHPREESLAK